MLDVLLHNTLWMKSEVVENTQGQTRARDMRIGAEMSSRLAAKELGIC